RSGPSSLAGTNGEEPGEPIRLASGDSNPSESTPPPQVDRSTNSQNTRMLSDRPGGFPEIPKLSAIPAPEMTGSSPLASQSQDGGKSAQSQHEVAAVAAPTPAQVDAVVSHSPTPTAGVVDQNLVPAQAQQPHQSTEGSMAASAPQPVRQAPPTTTAADP